MMIFIHVFWILNEPFRVSYSYNLQYVSSSEMPKKDWWNTWETSRNRKSIFILNTEPISKTYFYVTSFCWHGAIWFLHFCLALILHGSLSYMHEYITIRRKDLHHHTFVHTRDTRTLIFYSCAHCLCLPRPLLQRDDEIRALSLD